MPHANATCPLQYTRSATEIDVYIVLYHLNCIMADKFAISRSSARRSIRQMLDEVIAQGPQFIQWWNNAEKINSSLKFKALTGIDGIIGAVDGCHIRINRPSRKGDNYLNRKTYHSVLLQGVCDENCLFRHVYMITQDRQDVCMMHICSVCHLCTPGRWTRDGQVVSSTPIQPLHCRATTLGKLFTPMCLCSPSSIIWYLVRVYMVKALLVAAVYEPNDQGGYC